MKKIAYLLLSVVLLTSCFSSRNSQADSFKKLTVGMSKAEVEYWIGPPELYLSVTRTPDGVEEVLQYRNYYNEVFALEFINDYLVSANYIYSGSWYPMYQTYPPIGRPVFPPGYIPNRPAPRPPSWAHPRPPVNPRPPAAIRPPANEGRPPASVRPPANEGRPPASTRPPAGGSNSGSTTRPSGTGSSTRPSGTGNSGSTTRPSNTTGRESAQPRESTQSRESSGTSVRQNSSSGSRESSGNINSGSSGSSTSRGSGSSTTTRSRSNSR
ncbi:MAG: hypothetical protein LIO93_11815 [Bacteroidales bacterium]|nr:hypothetical protein [Bacteroidales bacterium]